VADINIKTKSGEPLESVVVSLEGILKPRKSDLLLAGQIIRAGIIDRTGRGVDADDRPFAPYDESRPYYYNPSTGGGKFTGQRFTAKAQRAAATRLLRKLENAPGAERSQNGKSIKFPSYGAFKRAFGRSNVDLRGVRAPHMLDAIVVQAVDEGGKIGIYDPRAATIASGHTTGIRPRGMPLRKFFAFNRRDIQDVKDLVRAQMLERLRSR
jgi:hypothetical protein